MTMPQMPNVAGQAATNRFRFTPPTNPGQTWPAMQKIQQAQALTPEQRMAWIQQLIQKLQALQPGQARPPFMNPMGANPAPRQTWNPWQ